MLLYLYFSTHENIEIQKSIPQQTLSIKTIVRISCTNSLINKTNLMYNKKENSKSEIRKNNSIKNIVFNCCRKPQQFYLSHFSLLPRSLEKRKIINNCFLLLKKMGMYQFMILEWHNQKNASWKLLSAFITTIPVGAFTWDVRGYQRLHTILRLKRFSRCP
jgi:hypothetical protein